MPDRSHSSCWRGDHYEHACQSPSGRTCVEAGCDLAAGTLWGPFWCPEHDVERLDRIKRQLEWHVWKVAEIAAIERANHA